MSVHIDYETFPPVDGTVADVYNNDELIGTMLFSDDLNQWNDCEFPGDVAAHTIEECATKMIEFRA